MTAGSAADRRRWEEQRRIYRRRRMLAVVVGVVLLVLLVRGCSALVGGGGGEEASQAAAPPELPRGGRLVLPRHRVVAYYGAPQDPELGVLGETPPEEAARKLADHVGQYARPGLPALPALELISTLAQSAPGDDGMHRLRQSDATIRRHLRAARAIRGLLVLDVQPGQADFFEEVRALERYLTQPDVGLALDPEWSVPEGTQPGSVIGSMDAEVVNEVSAYLARLVRLRDLPQKLLIVHQFTDEMITNRDQLATRSGVALVLNMDGFGTAELKEGVYDRLSQPTPRGPDSLGGPYNGFKLFFREDTGLMSSRDVLSLRPAPEVVVYE
ncbi:MAG: hypothetical protein ACRDLQ_05890 [Solirubrobacterales bacterium]